MDIETRKLTPQGEPVWQRCSTNFFRGYCCKGEYREAYMRLIDSKTVKVGEREFRQART